MTFPDVEAPKLNSAVALTRLKRQLAELAISNAGRRLKASKKVERKRITQGPALPGKLADCAGQDPARSELFLVEGDSAGG